MKVLIVEDSKTQMLLIKNLIEREGWETVTASNGEEGLKVAQASQPDVILSDLDMPKMDGFTFCQTIKNSPLKNIPFILLSAQGELDSRVKGLDIGADDFLTKPPSERELIARVRSAMRIKQYQDQLQVALDSLEEKNSQMVEELDQARITQSSILPQETPAISGVSIAAKYLPMEKIGGDFYDIVELRDKQLGLFVGDVTGHGISAALISFMGSSLFKTHCVGIRSPSLLLGIINDFLFDKIEEGKFLSAWYGIYDERTKYLSYSSAGHPPAYIIRHRDGEVVPLETSGMFLGIFPTENNPLTVKSVKLEAGDKVMIYTDGIVEMSTPDKKIFGWERLESFLKEHRHLSMSSLLDSLVAHVLEYSENQEFDDDITLLGLELKPD